MINDIIRINLFVLGAFFCTYFFIKFLKNSSISTKFIDTPNHRKLHEKNIPAIGGIAIIFTLFSFCIINYLFQIGEYSFKGDIVVVLIGTLLIFVAGLLDDLYRINIVYKLFFQIIACSIVVFMTELVKDFNWLFFLSFNSQIISSLISIIFMILIINSINFFDGLDGLLLGVSLIIIINFIILFYLLGVNSIQMVYMFIIAGSLFGLLAYNRYPAKIFLGDSGSLFIGWFFAILTFYYIREANSNASVLIPLAIFSLVILDTFFVVTNRFFNKKHIRLKKRFSNIFIPDRTHLHHRLSNIFQSDIKAVNTIHSVSFIISIFSILLYLVNKDFILLIGVIILYLFIAIIQLNLFKNNNY